MMKPGETRQDIHVLDRTARCFVCCGGARHVGEDGGVEKRAETLNTI